MWFFSRPPTNHQVNNTSNIAHPPTKDESAYRLKRTTVFQQDVVLHEMFVSASPLWCVS